MTAPFGPLQEVADIISDGTPLTIDKMRAAIRAMKKAEQIHQQNMLDPVYVAVAAGLACPIRVPMWISG